MGDLIRRLAWLFFVLCVLAYAIFLFIGSTIHAQAVDMTRIVNVRDVLQPGVHHMSGMVMVPKTCSELSVTSTAISSTTYKLIFTTWEEPSVSCAVDDTPRAFREVVFAPAAGVDFIATLDDVPLTVVVQQQAATSL